MENRVSANTQNFLLAEDGGHIMRSFWNLFAKKNVSITWKIMEKRIVNLLPLNISCRAILLQLLMQLTMQLECVIWLLPSGLLWLPRVLLALWVSHQTNHPCQKVGASFRGSPKTHLPSYQRRWGEIMAASLHLVLFALCLPGTAMGISRKYTA